MKKAKVLRSEVSTHQQHQNMTKGNSRADLLLYRILIH